MAKTTNSMVNVMANMTSSAKQNAASYANEREDYKILQQEYEELKKSTNLEIQNLNNEIVQLKSKKASVGSEKEIIVKLNELEKQNIELAKKKNELEKEIQKVDKRLEEIDFFEQFQEMPQSLDKIEKQIFQLAGKTLEIGWYIGKRLVEVRDKYIDGTEYQNIAEYAEAKFNLKRRTTFNYILLSEFSLVQVLALGSKLYLVGNLEDSIRNYYLEWIEKENPSFQKIEERIREEKKKGPGQPKKDISLQKTKLTVDFKKMGVEIEKDRTQEFLKRLDELIREFGKKNTEVNVKVD